MVILIQHKRVQYIRMPLILYCKFITGCFRIPNITKHMKQKAWERKCSTWKIKLEKVRLPVLQGKKSFFLVRVSSFYKDKVGHANCIIKITRYRLLISFKNAWIFLIKEQVYWKGEILYSESDILTDICIMLIGIYNKLCFRGLNLADKKWPIFCTVTIVRG